jgi:NAD(P)-dependent dehydrogenase (short-subunit alcohol dehydrogenase family)
LTTNALIVGAGLGLSAALARAFAAAGMHVSLAARNTSKLAALCRDIKADANVCDAADPASVRDLFAILDAQGRTPSLVVYNAGLRVRGPVAELNSDDIDAAWRVGAFGGFVVGQEAARRMLKVASGTILFTGATASIKGFALSSGFAMAKFALRALAQSMARELQPKGIHIAHIVIDGSIRSQDGVRAGEAESGETMLDADAIAEAYLALHRQRPTAWSHEIDLRPRLENF